MKYSHKKLITPESILEELSIKTIAKKNYLVLTVTISTIPAIHISLFISVKGSGKIEFDYLFTNSPSIEQKVIPQKSLIQKLVPVYK